MIKKGILALIIPLLIGQTFLLFQINSGLKELNISNQNIQNLAIHKIKVDQHTKQLELQVHMEVAKELKKRF